MARQGKIDGKAFRGKQKKKAPGVVSPGQQSPKVKGRTPAILSLSTITNRANRILDQSRKKRATRK